MRFGVFVFVVFFASYLPAQTGLVSRYVGKVSERAVTSREVEINFHVEKLMFPKTAPKVWRDAGEAGYQRAVDGVLIEWAVFLESKQFATIKVPDQGVAKALKELRRQMRKSALWRRLQPSDDELKGVIERKLRAKDFIQFRAKSSQLRVTDFDAQQYFRRNPDRFRGLDFEDYKEQIKSLLKKRELEQQLVQWFRVLQTKYKVSSRFG